MVKISFPVFKFNNILDFLTEKTPSGSEIDENINQDEVLFVDKSTLGAK